MSIFIKRNSYHLQGENMNVLKTVSGTTASILEVVEGTANLGGTYIKGWSERATLNEAARLTETKLEVRVRSIVAEQQAAADLATQIAKIQSKVTEQEFSAALAMLREEN